MQVDRLRRRAEFLYVAGGRRWAAPGLVLQARPRREGVAVGAVDARVGFTVSRKVGKAVERNRARRRLRAAAKEVMPMHAVSGMDYVIVGRRQTLGRDFSRLIADLDEAMRRVRAWQPAIAAPDTVEPGRMEPVA